MIMQSPVDLYQGGQVKTRSPAVLRPERGGTAAADTRTAAEDWRSSAVHRRLTGRDTRRSANSRRVRSNG